MDYSGQGHVYRGYEMWDSPATGSNPEPNNGDTTNAPDWRPYPEGGPAPEIRERSPETGNYTPVELPEGFWDDVDVDACRNAARDVLNERGDV